MLTARVVIEQARGMLAERHGMSPEVALELLRHHARASDRALREVAEEVVTGELDL